MGKDPIPHPVIDCPYLTSGHYKSCRAFRARLHSHFDRTTASTGSQAPLGRDARRRIERCADLHLQFRSIAYQVGNKSLKHAWDEIHEAKLKRGQFSFDIPLSSFIVIIVSVFP
ncbi:hypothetical protein [Rhizobium sp. LEGMi135b]